ncbi:MAG: hypothetical protein JWM82_3627, partial [Myxococcales bacterium]|nr:hypothetical protein [Myxococcales bacterium]
MKARILIALALFGAFVACGAPESIRSRLGGASGSPGMAGATNLAGDTGLGGNPGKAPVRLAGPPVGRIASPKQHRV